LNASRQRRNKRMAFVHVLSTDIAALIPLILSIVSPTAVSAAQYVFDGTNSPLACTEFANETCTAECSSFNASYAAIVNCGESGQCVVDCTALNCASTLEINAQSSNDVLINNVASCISSSIVINVDDGQDLTLNVTGDSHAPLILNAENGTAIDVFSSVFRGLYDAVVYVPNTGDATLSMSAGESFSGLTVNAGSDTQAIRIDCTFGTGDECHGLQVDATTAQFLQIDVGLDSELNGGAVIDCPVDSAYTNAQAPCVIDLSGGGSVNNATIHAADGIPGDVWFEMNGTDAAAEWLSSSVSVSLVCSAGQSEAPLSLASDCWHTPSPTLPGLSAQKDPTVSPTVDPTISPTVLPTLSPTAPTDAPTKPPNLATAAQSLDRLTLIIIVCAGVLGGVLVCCAITICCYIRYVQSFIEKEKSKYANSGPQVWDPRLVERAVASDSDDGPGANTGHEAVGSDEDMPGSQSVAVSPPQNPASLSAMFGFGNAVQVPMQPQPYAPPHAPHHVGAGAFPPFGGVGVPLPPGAHLQAMAGMSAQVNLPSQPQVNVHMQNAPTPNAHMHDPMMVASYQSQGYNGEVRDDASSSDDEDQGKGTYMYTKGTSNGGHPQAPAENHDEYYEEEEEEYEYYDEEEEDPQSEAMYAPARKKPAPPPPRRGQHNQAQGSTPMQLNSVELASSSANKKAGKWSKWQAVDPSSPAGASDAVGVSYDDGVDFGNQAFGKNRINTPWKE